MCIFWNSVPEAHLHMWVRMTTWPDVIGVQTRRRPPNSAMSVVDALLPSLVAGNPSSPSTVRLTGTVMTLIRATSALPVSQCLRKKRCFWWVMHSAWSIDISINLTSTITLRLTTAWQHLRDLFPYLNNNVHCLIDVFGMVEPYLKICVAFYMVPGAVLPLRGQLIWLYSFHHYRYIVFKLSSTAKT